MNEVQPYYKFRAEAGAEPQAAELLIFDVIGNWDDMGEVGAKQFAVALSTLPTSVKRLDIHINSPGGSVHEAYGIYSRLADHRSEKIVYIDGLAASAASLVAMVGHKIYIRANANVMVHLPMALAIGNADDMRTVIAALDSVTESMINVYAKRTKQSRDKLRSLMAAETWMHPEEAVANGFADEMRGVVKAAACIGDKRVMINGMTFDLSRFHNVPAFSGQPNQTMNEPTAAAPNPGTANPPQPPPPTPQPGTNPPPPPAPVDPPRPTDPPRPPPPPPKRGDASAEYDRGVTDERARVAALTRLDKPATHAIIMQAIAEGKQPSDITAELLDAMEKANTQRDRRIDASGVDHIPPSDGGDNNSATDAFATALKSNVAARRKTPAVHSRN